MTFDRHSVQTQLGEAQIGFAGEKTAIGDAVGLSIKRLQGNDEQSRILILLTDGANTAGEVSPKKAAELAAQARVKIYTVGMGADEMIVPG
ncbi:MAG: VWA domain-containing protein, partial [Pseudomonadales bacterium]